MSLLASCRAGPAAKHDTPFWDPSWASVIRLPRFVAHRLRAVPVAGAARSGAGCDGQDEGHSQSTFRRRAAAHPRLLGACTRRPQRPLPRRIDEWRERRGPGVDPSGLRVQEHSSQPVLAHGDDFRAAARIALALHRRMAGALLWRTPAFVPDSRVHVGNGMGNGVRVQGSPKVEGTKDQALYYALSRAGKAWSSHILLPLPQTEPRGKAQAAVW